MLRAGAVLRAIAVRRNRSALALGLGALALLLVWGATPARAETTLQAERARYSPGQMAAILRLSPLPPLPDAPTDRVANDPQAAALGQFLFFDARLSANGQVSCAFCHQPWRAFADGRALARGIALGTRNTPTVLDAAYNHWFFLDGRTDSLWSQALQPFENPHEFGGDRLAIMHTVDGDPAMRAAYERVFGPLPALGDAARFPPHGRPGADPGTPEARAWASMAPADRVAVNRAFSNLGKAIEAYERRLVGGNSPFDRYVAALKGGNRADLAAISPAAKRGLGLFVGRANCTLCHSGPTFTDGQFHNLGLPVLPGEQPDPGRAAGIPLVKADPFNGNGAFSDAPSGAAKDRIDFLPPPKSQLGAFKTPTLRNVALTAPYMHDGRFTTLAQVLAFYAKGQAASNGRLVGKREATANLVPHLSARQQADLVAFLKTLTSPPLPLSLTTAPTHP